MKYFTKSFTDPIFKHTIKVHNLLNLKEAKLVFLNYFEDSSIIESSAALTFSSQETEQSGTIIHLLFWNKPTFSHIIHECVHASQMILSDCGISLEVYRGNNMDSVNSSRETYAYHTGYIIENVCDLFRSNGYKLA
jgi:hypothetical protein